jgi:indole-3-glycerol phosphate synthase
MFLDSILAHTREELAVRKQRVPLEILGLEAAKQPPPLSLSAALSRHGLCIIAEVKKASPSKGLICKDFDPLKIAVAYVDGGAAAISVLTETKYFQGSLDYLKDIRKVVSNKPLLRKDFIVDPYQVYESRAYGADSLLLIVAALSSDELTSLLTLSDELGMECLVEVHNEQELETALNSQAKIIGINNRNLSTFEVDLNVTFRLRPSVPAGLIAVSESGIKSRADIEKMRELNVNAVLIGETLVSSPDIASKIKELLA